MNLKGKKPFQNFLLDKFFCILPFDLYWYDTDGNCLNSLHEVFLLLDKNYVEDCFSFLRFTYVHEFIKLAVCSPKWALFLNLGVKYHRTRKLNGFISSTFRKIINNNKLDLCSEINFLCLQKNLRRKFFVQELIKEITRRLNCFGVTTAIYTTGLPFLKPFLNINYFYNQLNLPTQYSLKCKKSEKLPNINLERVEKWQDFICIQKMDSGNIENVKSIRKEFRKKKIYKHFNFQDFSYWIRFLEGFKYTFIYENKFLTKNKSIISLYSLPCKTIKSRKPYYFYDVYFYYGIQSIENKIFIEKILSICKIIGFDLFYILDGIFSEKNLLNLYFRKGENRINFYLIGGRTKRSLPVENGLIFF